MIPHSTKQRVVRANTSTDNHQKVLWKGLALQLTPLESLDGPKSLSALRAKVTRVRGNRNKIKVPAIAPV